MGRTPYHADGDHDEKQRRHSLQSILTGTGDAFQPIVIVTAVGVGPPSARSWFII
jgi:hypothetical protein